MQKIIEDKWLNKFSHLKWKDIYLWPLYKPHLFQYLSTTKSNGLFLNNGIRFYFSAMVKAILNINFIFKLKKHKIWLINSSRDYLVINEEWQSRYAQGLINHHQNELLSIESNISGVRKRINGKSTIDETVFLFYQFFIYLYFLVFKPKFEGEEYFHQFNVEKNETYNYKSRFYRFLAQYYFLIFLLKFKKPEVVYVVCYYSYIGYINALKKKGVNIIELQHGIVNENHFAYNFKYKEIYSSSLPNYFLSYGEFEKNIFLSKAGFINPKNVFPIGSYIIDFYKKNKIEPIDFGVQSKYKIVFSGQNILQDEALTFLNRISKIMGTEYLFIYVPRVVDNTKKMEVINENLVIYYQSNIYELIKLSDLHMTIYSSTAIESLALGVPNLFYDFKGLSTKYFEEFKGKFGCEFVNTEDDSIKQIRQLSKIKNKAKIELQVSRYYEISYSYNLEMFTNKASTDKGFNSPKVELIRDE